jgi:hypothetical protein
MWTGRALRERVQEHILNRQQAWEKEQNEVAPDDPQTDSLPVEDFIDVAYRHRRNNLRKRYPDDYSATNLYWGKFPREMTPPKGITPRNELSKSPTERADMKQYCGKHRRMVTHAPKGSYGRFDRS